MYTKKRKISQRLKRIKGKFKTHYNFIKFSTLYRALKNYCTEKRTIKS